MIRKFSIYTILLISLSIVTSVFAKGREGGLTKKYHVSLKGSDANDGSSKTPFRSIRKGASMLKAGDTLLVHSGQYGYEPKTIVENSGTKEAPIVILAEKPGAVILTGPRKKDEEELSEEASKNAIAFIVKASNIEINGFYITNYSTGLKIQKTDYNGKSKNVKVTRCTFDNNGSAGIVIANSNYSTISDCIFITDAQRVNNTYRAVQDYGVGVYSSKGIVLEENYFYGAHNQAMSFKEGDTNCVARRNIVEGVGHFGIILGQNRIEFESENNSNPTCNNLTFEYNIIRGAKGFRVKTPIMIDNVNNAIVQYNYIEGFDEGDQTCGITILNEPQGKIEITNNIIAFGVKNHMSGGVYQAWNFENNTIVNIKNNTMYKVSKDFINLRHERGGSGNAETKNAWTFAKNIAYKTAFYKSKVDRIYNTENFREDPQFINGNPIQQPIAIAPVKPDFDSYYKKLTEPFKLKMDSPAEGFGVQFN